MKTLSLIPKKKWRSALVGNYASAFRWAGIEFGNIREYVPGDDSKYIDWRSSAKGNKLFVKEFEESRNVTILLFLDAGSNMHFGTTPVKKWQKAEELFDILTYGAIKNHDRIGGGIFDENLSQFFPPKSGMVNAHLLKQSYLRSVQKAQSGFSSVGKLVEGLYQKQIKRNVIFLVSDCFDDIDFRKFRSLACKNEIVCVQILDPFETSGQIPFWARLSDGTTTISASTMKDTRPFLQAMKTRIEETKKAIVWVGASYLLLSTQEDILESLFHFFKTRQ